MKNNKLNKISTILFYGAIWGILEASLGYVLHFVPTFIAGTIMFPIVSVLLVRAYAKTNSKASLVFIGLVASFIKGINLFMPQYSIWKTINPMISIVVESILVLAVIQIISKDKPLQTFVALPLVSIGWRVLFLANLGIQFLANGYLATQISGIYPAFEFVILSGIVSGVIGVSLLVINSLWNKKIKLSVSIKPVLSFITFALAIVITILL
ncbi:MAG: hypothetical protein KJ971_08225 [Firmicutes bacterium]|nr:hypothetical protein [Bacillota bacterium]